MAERDVALRAGRGPFRAGRGPFRAGRGSFRARRRGGGARAAVSQRDVAVGALDSAARDRERLVRERDALEQERAALKRRRREPERAQSNAGGDRERPHATLDNTSPLPPPLRPQPALPSRRRNTRPTASSGRSEASRPRRPAVAPRARPAIRAAIFQSPATLRAHARLPALPLPQRFRRTPSVRSAERGPVAIWAARGTAVAVLLAVLGRAHHRAAVGLVPRVGRCRRRRSGLLAGLMGFWAVGCWAPGCGLLPGRPDLGRDPADRDQRRRILAGPA